MSQRSKEPGRVPWGGNIPEKTCRKARCLPQVVGVGRQVGCGGQKPGLRSGGIQRRGGSPPHSAQISEPSVLRPMGRPASASSHPGGLTGHPVGLVNPSRCVLASTLLQEEPGFAAHSPCSGRHVTGGSSSPPWSSESSDPLLAALLGSAELCMCIAPSQRGLCPLFTVMETHGTLLVKVWSTGQSTPGMLGAFWECRILGPYSLARSEAALEQGHPSWGMCTLQGGRCWAGTLIHGPEAWLSAECGRQPMSQEESV